MLWLLSRTSRFVTVVNVRSSQILCLWSLFYRFMLRLALSNHAEDLIS